MNATVQKIDDKKELYWKFARTSVWMEYFEVNNAIPPPFTFLNILWLLTYHSFFCVRRLRRWLRENVGGKGKNAFESCTMDKESYEKRVRHGFLLRSLVDRYLKTREAEGLAESEAVRKEDLERVRREVVDELMARLAPLRES